ncbi:E3 ubiquitin-protein ligase ZNF598 [Anopheles nili]|uniref:E3 ubiquitin-protein ligase ZNF598 n=1 Tax=Anopheles nili TaxID=185578 RepID=UPI00237C3EC0|nr:E3 ubiquitin-protein ligase ZNF598 [Anopheles nili]
MANKNRRPSDGEKNLPEMEANSEILCVVCFKPIVYFAIGECDHVCCYECSTRIRVLCQQNDCPICRRDLAKVIFSKTLLPYQQLDIKNRSGLYDKKYRICFTEQQVQQAFFQLLDNKCPRCDQSNFPKFEMLREHVRKKHELFYCDICTQHLKVFSSERRCYNRQDLAMHRRKGDPDKIGHRGHPLCEYCDTRFLDKDELFRHLRKDHFFCHYCDADGRNYFYGDYVSLREHFRTDHFLCEEGECEQEQFTSVFRSEIDLRAHRASMHGKSMNRLANKQTRTLELEFTYAPRHGATVAPGGGGSFGAPIAVSSSGGGGGGGGPSNRGRGGRGNGNAPRGGGAMLEGHQRRDLDGYEAMNDQQVPQHPRKEIDATNEEDFPSLAGSTPNPVFRPNNVSIRQQRVYGAAGLARTKENFPALGSSGGECTTGPTSLNEGFSSKITASSLLKSSQQSSGAGTTSMMIHVSNRPSSASSSGTGKSNNVSVMGKKKSSDFPALPSGSGDRKGSSVSVSNTRKLTSDNGGINDADDRSSGGAAMVNLNAISAKHRALVDDYVSLSSVVSKVKTIPSTVVKVAATTQAAVPSVNSTKAFPSLGETGSKTAASVPMTKSTPWAQQGAKQSNVLGSSNASSAVSGSAISGGIQATSKKKPTPAPNLKNDAGFVNLNALTGKKSGEKNKRKDSSPPHAGASNHSTDSRNNNGGGESSAKASSGKEHSSKEQHHQTKQLQGKSSAHVAIATNSAALHTSQANNNATVPAYGNSVSVIGSGGSNRHNGTQFKSPVSSAGPKRTPPGFENVNLKTKSAGPPPGFSAANVTLTAVARNVNNMTFINSIGETYDVLPLHSYVAPPNASKRNQILVTHFQKALQSQEALLEFKTISQMFRDDQYNASAYYDHCKAALGDRFHEIFPELIALLPNILKQQELYLVYCQDEKTRPKSSAKGKAAVVSTLEVCQVCKQVLTQEDLTQHYQTHYLENNFPKLGVHPPYTVVDEPKMNSFAKK